MDDAPPIVPQRLSVRDVFENVKARRSALLKAVTTEKGNLCLYGHASGNWEVKKPPEEDPLEIPRPSLGMNFARDQMKQEEWVAMIADYSQAWLFSVAFYISAKHDFDKIERKQLFDMINELPTIFEVIRGKAEKQPEESSSTKTYSSVKTMSNTRVGFWEKEEGDTECGGCEENTRSHFWICCDLCDSWYHGKCVKITPKMAKYIEQYTCPICNKKKPTSGLALRIYS